jgi:hypothetical protein
MTVLVLAALHLSLFTNGGAHDTGLGLVEINGNRGTLTAINQYCVAKMSKAELRRIEAAVLATKPNKWRPSYSSDCLECSGLQLVVNNKHVNFDEEAKLPPDLDALRKALVDELNAVNKRCAPKPPGPSQKPRLP